VTLVETQGLSRPCVVHPWGSRRSDQFFEDCVNPGVVRILGGFGWKLDSSHSTVSLNGATRFHLAKHLPVASPINQSAGGQRLCRKFVLENETVGKRQPRAASKTVKLQRPAKGHRVQSLLV
jgi:hypothetical protein